MKNIFLILLVPIMLIVINGCNKDDEIVYNNVNNYYDVTFNNLEYDKYITSITIREVTHGTGEWGPNQLDDTIWGRQSWTITMQEGVYDFKILMEDSLYYYTATESNVIVDGDITMNVCYDCKNMVFNKEKKVIPDSRPVQKLQYKKVLPKKVYKGL